MAYLKTQCETFSSNNACKVDSDRSALSQSNLDTIWHFFLTVPTSGNLEADIVIIVDRYISDTLEVFSQSKYTDIADQSWLFQKKQLCKKTELNQIVSDRVEKKRWCNKIHM